mgnify:CR=1 FL=1
MLKQERITKLQAEAESMGEEGDVEGARRVGGYVAVCVWDILPFYELILSFFFCFDSSLFTRWGAVKWAWAWFVLLLSTLVCCQPTELIWVSFFIYFINFTILPPPPSAWQRLSA